MDLYQMDIVNGQKNAGFHLSGGCERRRTDGRRRRTTDGQVGDSIGSPCEPKTLHLLFDVALKHIHIESTRISIAFGAL